MFQIGQALVDGAATTVVCADARVTTLQGLLGIAPAPDPFDMLVDWDGWCDRIADALRGATPSESISADRITWLPPVSRPPKLICLGTNYRAHAAEVSAEPLKLPYAFFKPPSTTLNASGRDIILLSGAEMNDWEIELAVVIGRETQNVSETEALSRVAGYTVMNDVSVRDHVDDRSKFLGIDWVLAKAADGYAPMGPWLTPARFVPDPQALAMELTVNDRVMQQGTTADMLFGVATTIAHLSRTMTLETGDIIATGTPDGVGFGRKPPVFLQHGDVVRCTIDGLGTLENRFIRA